MNIAVLEPLGLSQAALEKIFNERMPKEARITYYPDRKEDVETLVERSKDAEIVVLSNLPYPKEVIERCPKLKAIMVAFTGVDHIAIETCHERHITVCNCSGYADSAVADLVFGMVISFYRSLAACDQRSRKHGTKDGLMGMELENKIFGIIGAGKIGTHVGVIANAFGAKVLAYSRTERYHRDLTYVSLDELLTKSDIVSLHVPATKDTYHMIGERELGLMKQNALLVNTARGSVVDENALAQALIQGRIGGACIDVLEQEPPFDEDHPILHAPNVVITPHIGYATVEAMEKRAEILSYNIKAYMEGTPIHVIQ